MNYNCIFELRRIRINLVNDYNIISIRYNSIMNNASGETAKMLCDNLKNCSTRLFNELNTINNLINTLDLLNKHYDISNKIKSIESRINNFTEPTVISSMNNELSSLRSDLTKLEREINGIDLYVGCSSNYINNIYPTGVSTVSNVSSNTVFNNSNGNPYDYKNILSRIDLSKFNISSDFNNNSNSNTTFNNTSTLNLNLNSNLNSTGTLNLNNNNFYNELVNKATGTWINGFKKNAYGLKEDSLSKYYSVNDVDNLINSRSVNASNREKAVIASLSLIELGLNKNVTTKYELSTKHFNSISRPYETTNVINNGVDCASLTSWALNKSTGRGFNNATLDTISKLGVSTNYNNVKAGDILVHSSHAMMVIDNNPSSNYVIVSDASRSDNNFMSGARLQQVSYSTLDKLGFKARDLTSFYSM